MPKIDTTVGNLVEMIRNGELRLPEIEWNFKLWGRLLARETLQKINVKNLAQSDFVQDCRLLHS
jgi:hypothetical protein